ncbi:MAG: hypothetical protein J5563_00385 [Clostridia bacterium]|nr:hypothetical protein [Clostridia bacterium]
MAKNRIKLEPSANSGQKPQGIKTETPLNRRMAQATRGSEPGTVRRAAKQTFKVEEGRFSDVNQKRKKEKREKPAKLSPDTTSRGITEEEIRKNEFRKEKERHSKRSFIGTRIVLVLGAYVVLSGILAAAMYFWWLPHQTTAETQNYVYQLGPDSDRLKRVTVPWQVVRTGNVYYVNMSDIASMCNLAITGDGKSFRFIVKETGEYISLTLGSGIAEINGVYERMEGECYLYNGSVYVPLNFVNSVVGGVTATLNLSTNKLTVESDGSVISFPFIPDSVTPAIRFVDLDIEIQREIILREQMRQEQNAAQ